MDDSDEDSIRAVKKAKPALQYLGKLSNDFVKMKQLNGGGAMNSYMSPPQTSPMGGQSADYHDLDNSNINDFSDIDISVRQYQSAVRSDHKMKAQIRNQIIHWGK